MSQDPSTYPPDGIYRVEAALDPGADGYYRVRIYLGDELLDTVWRTDRDTAVQKATAYVAWHREHSEAVEVIEL